MNAATEADIKKYIASTPIMQEQALQAAKTILQETPISKKNLFKSLIKGGNSSIYYRVINATRKSIQKGGNKGLTRHRKRKA